ncbi:MAG TPA: twin transmembrane helix small protein [Methylocystis sp.]|nr:twin transmembrane helix small protein [Methylocystis sp.]
MNPRDRDALWAKGEIGPMAQFSNILLLAAVAAVALVLILGVANMMRGGSPEKSQSLMRWRVGLQLLAIAIIVAILFFRR